jgi:hypothetical protein
MDGWHAPDDMMARYVAGAMADWPGEEAAGGLGPDEVWSIEAHLETCPDCRARLAAEVHTTSSRTAALIGEVRSGLAAALPRVEQGPARRRSLARWIAPAALPWLTAVAAVLLATAGLAAAAGRPAPALSPVLLLAPLVPLLAVAASWGQVTDPAYELVAAGPRAGLEMVLRRTLAALMIVLPALAAAGWATGTAPARWLLPCLAFTSCTLALGDMVGVRRAAAGLAAAWAVGVIGPSMVNQRLSFLLQPEILPAWAVLALVAAAVVAARRNAYRYLVGAS